MFFKSIAHQQYVDSFIRVIKDFYGKLQIFSKQLQHMCYRNFNKLPYFAESFDFQFFLLKWYLKRKKFSKIILGMLMLLRFLLQCVQE